MTGVLKRYDSALAQWVPVNVPIEVASEGYVDTAIDTALAEFDAGTPYHVGDTEPADENIEMWYDTSSAGSYTTDLSTVRSGKDSEGLFTTIEWTRPDGTLYAKSVLSEGTSPQYTKRTVTYYQGDGIIVKSTVTYDLVYDVDGDLVSETFV